MATRIDENLGQLSRLRKQNPLMISGMVALGCSVSAMLAGCQTVNGFSANVVTYNNQAEKSIDAGLVLNTLRASKRRPLVFADLQTISGANPASGSLGFSVPLANVGSTATTMTPSLTVAGGPTTTVGIVNTQEFYKGILAPVPMSTLDLFVQRGLSRDLLFNLLISKIIVTNVPPATTDDPASRPKFPAVEAKNYPGDDRELGPFQRLIETLLDEGLTTAADKGGPLDYGPPLVDIDFIGSDAVAKSIASGLEVNEESWCDLDPAQHADVMRRFPPKLAKADPDFLKSDCDKLDALDSGEVAESMEKEIRKALADAGLRSAFYQPQKPAASVSALFCFDTDAQTASPDDATKSAYCPSSARSHPDSQHRDGPGKEEKAITMSANSTKGGKIKAIYCELVNLRHQNEYPNCINDNKNSIFKLEFVMRSTYSVLYYIGEVIRRQHYPDDISSPDIAERNIYVRRSNDNNEKCDIVRYDGINGKCATIFDLSRNRLHAQGLFDVLYDGSWWSIDDAGPNGGSRKPDKTYETMDLVTEILNLNRSAKDLPTSSVVTLVGAR